MGTPPIWFVFAILNKKPEMKEILMELYERLFRSFGPQGWWPAESPFEVFVGAILTQNTAWRNVEKAIANLKQKGDLTPEAIHRMSIGELEELIKPSGFYKVKARRLKEAVAFLLQEFGGRMDLMAKAPLQELRSKLLKVKGIGEETADSILLYACDKPIFVVDAYTKRILSRHGITKDSNSYQGLQRLFMDALPKNVALFKEYHALLVRLGKSFCRPRPRCEGCPLEGVKGVGER